MDLDDADRFSSAMIAQDRPEHRPTAVSPVEVLMTPD
jgi:hypothetical protein